MSEQLPVQCSLINVHLGDLNFQLEELQEQLVEAGTLDKARILKLIVAKESAILDTENDLEECIQRNSGPEFKVAPKATIPLVSTDTTLVQVKKTISWNLLQKKFDEFLNQR